VVSGEMLIELGNSWFSPKQFEDWLRAYLREVEHWMEKGGFAYLF